jgi:TIR domain
LMLKVFISSSAEGASLARRLAKDLEQRGFLTDLPSRDLAEGVDYAQLDQRVAEAGAFLVLAEPNPRCSAMLQREWFAILNEASGLTKKKKLIPLVLGDGEPPNFLKNWQVLHVRDPQDPKRLQKLVDTIADAVQSKQRPRFKAFRKTDLERRARRLESIAATARELKALGQ